MSGIYIPTLLFWENGNSWYGSQGDMRFYMEPVKQPDGTAVLETQIWRGPLAKDCSPITNRASFPCTEEGLVQVQAWLEEQARAAGDRS